MARGLSQVEIIAAIDAGHVRVQTWTDLHRHLEEMRDTGWIFRGVTSPKHYPVPRIGREQIYGRYEPLQEARLFEEFKLRVVALLREQRFDDWDLLAYAQHIGVPARLLDWTSSPLVAVFFALEGDSYEDRVLYAVKYSRYIYEVDQSARGPLENQKEGRYTAPLAFDRIRAQRGLFTIHPNPTQIFYAKGLQTLLIPHIMVSDFRRRLFKYGIDHWHIYPDSQGLGAQMAWQYKHRVGLGRDVKAASKHDADGSPTSR